MKNNLILPPLEDFHTDFIKTASIIKVTSPISQIRYMDMVSIPDENGNETVALKAFNKTISLTTKQVSSSMRTSQLKELNENFGIDSTLMMLNTMCNEKISGMEKELYKKYTEIAVNSDILLTARQKFFRRFFKKMKFPIYADSDRKVLAKILLFGNLIATRHRRGPADFIVVGPRIASMLQDMPMFVMLPLDITNNRTINPIGSLAGITVYTNASLSWKDTSVLVGRSTKLSESGVYLLEMEDWVEEFVEHNSNDTKIMLRSRQAIADTMGADTKYVYVNLELTTPPKWRKWLKLI
jgi:hypothetical protein